MRQTTRGQRPRENHSIKARLGPTPGRSTGKVLLRRRSVGDGDGTVKVRNLEPVERRLDFFARTLTAGVLMSSDGLFDEDTAQVQVLRCAFSPRVLCYNFCIRNVAKPSGRTLRMPN